MNLAAQAQANGGGCNKVSFQAYFPQLEQGGGLVSFKVDVMTLLMSLKMTMLTSITAIIMVVMVMILCFF